MKTIVGLRRICFLLTFLICTLAISLSAEGAEKQVVRVAYFDMGEYYTEVSEGNVKSYDTEALKKIEDYSDLKFVYVNCGTWANALSMLSRHEVDLVGTVQWTYEREQKYEFCLESYGYTVGELSGLKNRNFVYEDYDTIGKSVIGTTKDYVRMSEMNSVFEQHGISPVIKTYAGQKELENALESGEVDLIAANSHTIKSDCTVVEKFSFAPFYLVSWKGNEALTDIIDDAIIEINLREPTSDDKLLQKYFPSIIGAPLTKEELCLIAQGKTYDIYFDAFTKPTSWYDEKTGKMQGALIEVCRQLNEITGLKLNPVPIFQNKTVLTGSENKTTTLFNGISDDMSGTPGVTKAFLNEDFNLYYRKDNKIDLSSDAFSVAVVRNRNHLINYLRSAYPNSDIMQYDTPLDCLKAVNAGEIDLAYLDCHIANNAITEGGLSNVREFPIQATHQGIAVMFRGENNELLESIVNKGLEQVNQTEISKLFIQYALEAHEPVNFSTILRNHLGWLIFGICFICLALILIAVLFTYARVMKKQKDKIAKADSDKTEFFSRMSHDMRTPMNGILGMIRLSKDSDDVGEIHENLVKAEAAGEYMLSLINDTLDLQRLETKKLKLEKDVVNVGDYYNEIFSIMKISAEQKQLDFKVKYIGLTLDNYIELDSVRVKQILSNLISNAIKFTPEGGAVEVTVEALGKDGDILHRKYTVRDTGVGMSEDFINNRLFKPYSQENNELSSQLTGTGLGMAITKNLVEMMGGHLEVESAIGEGTAFSVYLDIRQAAKEVVQQAEKEKREREKAIISDLSGKHILLCEDHPLNAEIAVKLLKNVGCEVEWAENGKAGLDAFVSSEAHPFDAILMDIRMPVMDGLTAARAIRKTGRRDAATIPIIAMSANAYDEDIQKSIDAGMNGHIPKPVNPKTLYQTLSKSFDR